MEQVAGVPAGFDELEDVEGEGAGWGEIFLDRYLRLFERAAQRTEGEYRMARNHAACVAPPQHYMAATLPDSLKSEALQSTNCVVSGDLPQFRHMLPRRSSGEDDLRPAKETLPGTTPWLP